MQTWADFAADLEAPAVGGTSWPPYDAEDPMLVLDETLSTEKAFADARCDFWDFIAP